MAPSRSPESDRAAIREIVDGWIIWRDGGDWDRLSNAWHPGGRMISTRFDGLATDFVAQTKAAYEADGRVKHMQGGFWCETSKDRAISVTGMSILQRAIVHGVEVDVTCLGAFVDFFSYRDGRWAIERRRPAYDRDRMDPVTPGATLNLDSGKLASFPPAYRHLAYVQDGLGHTINRDLAETRGHSWSRLMAAGRAWLAEDAGSASDLPSPRRIITG